MEAALRELEAKLADAQGAADAHAKALKRARAAAKAGNAGELQKALGTAEQRGQAASAASSEAASAWQFDPRAHFASGAYLDELRGAAEAAGLKLFEKDGRLYCFPLLLRLDPGEAAVRIGKTLERRVRPGPLVAQLAALQTRAQKLKEPQFLDLLYKAYQRIAGADWRKVTTGPGPVVPLADLHELLTLLPGSDYPIEEFGRDLLLLDRKPDLRTKDGASFQLPTSTIAKEKLRRIVVYDEDGRERLYVAIRFVRES